MNERNREQRARRTARRQGFTLNKLRGNFYRDDPDQAWMLSRDGVAELYGNNGGVSFDEVEAYLAQKEG